MTPSELFDDHQQWARQIAVGVARRRGIQDFDLAAQAGLIGLWHASQSYRPGKASFKTYAGIRIRGAVIDWARADSALPRHRWQDIDLVSSDVLLERPDESPEPSDALDASRLIAQLWTWIALLPPRERRIMSRVARGETCADIARSMGVTLSRIAQIRTDCIQRMAAMARQS